PPSRPPRGAQDRPPAVARPHAPLGGGPRPPLGRPPGARRPPAPRPLAPPPRPPRPPRLTPQGLGVPPRRTTTRRGLRCASWRYLLLGELQALLPLEPELLHRKHDLPRPDRRDLEAPQDLAGHRPVHLVVRHVPQYRHAARRVPPVVVDAHELQVREQRADVPRLEERQERVPPPAFVPERFAHQPRRRRVRTRRRVARGGGGRLRRRGGRHRLGCGLGLRLGLRRERAGDEQRHDDSRELCAHGLAPPTFAGFWPGGGGGGAAALTKVRIANCASSSAPSVSLRNRIACCCAGLRLKSCGTMMRRRLAMSDRNSPSWS